MIKRLVCAVVTVCAASVVCAQGNAPEGRSAPARAISEAEVRAWLESMLERPPATERLRSLQFSWRSVEQSRVSDAELQALRAEVQNDPSSPSRGLLEHETVQRELFQGRENNVLSVWWEDATNWRINVDSPDRNSKAARDRGYSPFSDVATTRSGTWSFDERMLTIAGPSNERASTAMQSVLSAVRYGIVTLFDAFLSRPPPSVSFDPPPPVITVEGDRWKAVVRWPLAEAIYEGRWDRTSNRFVVDSLRYSKHPDPFRQNLVWQFSDWISVPGHPGEYAAARVVALHNGSVPHLVLSDLKVRPLEEGEFARVSRVPDPLGDDAIRGPLKVRSVLDHRVSVASERSEDGRVIRTTPLTPDPPASTPWRMIGWALLAGCVCALLAIWRVRSVRASRAAAELH